MSRLIGWVSKTSKGLLSLGLGKPLHRVDHKGQDDIAIAERIEQLQLEIEETLNLDRLPDDTVNRVEEDLVVEIIHEVQLLVIATVEVL